ncbi:hypothetical protein WME99_08620 [Sorangium sp. So ce136]|uniref:hypothetical protein n=1 Tax=Sorangium sp. So ce136 TaxID=3133284 RepID=UPI003F11D180
MKKVVGMLFASVALIAAGAVAAPPAARAGTVVAICAAGSAEFKIDPDSGEVTGTATLSGCTAPGRPDIHSATVSISGHAPVSTPLLTETITTDTITWNTGETTSETHTRTFAGVSAVVEVGAGASVAGLFHPFASAETGTGTRTNPSVSPLAAPFDFTYDINILTLTFEGTVSIVN